MAERSDDFKKKDDPLNLMRVMPPKGTPAVLFAAA
jgi:hypothetical protein